MTASFRRAATLLALLAPLASCSPAGSLDKLVPKDEDAYARGQIEAVARGDTAALLRDLDPSPGLARRPRWRRWRPCTAGGASNAWR